MRFGQMGLGLGLALGKGGGVPLSVEETAAFYSDDFESYANGTLLTAATPPWTWEGATEAYPTVQDGELQTASGDFGNSGDNFVYQDMGNANHWTELTLGASPSGATSGIMFAEEGISDFARLRYNVSGSISLAEIVSGSASDLHTHSLVATRRSKFDNSIVATDTLTVQIFGGKAYLFKCGIRIGSKDGYSLTPAGDRIGFPNPGSAWLNADKIQGGPLAGKVTIGNSWRCGAQTAVDGRFSFPRTQNLGGFANGACDITVDVDVQGTVEDFAFGLIDPETGKLIKLDGDGNLYHRCRSSSLVSGSTYDVTIRVPAGLTELFDGSSRQGRKPYHLRIVPTNDTRGFDTHPNFFFVTYTILAVGQSLAAYLQNTVNYVTDHPGGARFFVNNPPTGSEIPQFATGWTTSTSETTASDKNAGALTEWLSEMLDLPVMVVNAAIGATSAFALDPDAISSNGTFIRAAMSQSGGAFDMIFCDQGQNEIAGTVAAALDWKPEWTSHFPAYEAYANQPSNVPVLIYVGGRTASGSLDEPGNIVRKSQSDIIADLAALGITAALAGSTIGVTLADNVHPSDTAAGFGRYARRMALSAGYALGVNPYDGRGPLIDTANISRVGAVITIPVLLNGADSLAVLNGDGTDAAASASALSGWKVADSYNASTGAYTNELTVGAGITSVALSGSDIVITLDSTPSGDVVVTNYHGRTPDISSYVFGAYSDATFGSFNIAMMPIIDPVTVS